MAAGCTSTEDRVCGRRKTGGKGESEEVLGALIVSRGGAAGISEAVEAAIDPISGLRTINWSGSRSFDRTFRR